VGVDGKPGDVEVVTSSRNRDLDREAVRTVRRWRFQPAMRDGVPVPAVVRQTINFSAPERRPSPCLDLPATLPARGTWNFRCRHSAEEANRWRPPAIRTTVGPTR